VVETPFASTPTRTPAPSRSRTPHLGTLPLATSSPSKAPRPILLPAQLPAKNPAHQDTSTASELFEVSIVEAPTFAPPHPVC